MSAIWGVISLKGARISKDISSKMRQPLSDYKLDSIEEVIDNEVYMACGHQWITREDHEDKLPFYDEKRETFYTADCMIDNREELVNALGVVEGTPSGRLLYLSYLKWGPSLPDLIL